MADAGARPWPSELRLNPDKTALTIAFNSGESFELAAEYLRVESPSAEVKGHGPGQEVTVAGKRLVTITDLEATGNYAVRISFSDGHSTGLYSWDYLHKLGLEHDEIWQAYLDKLAKQGLGRD
jgi:DUF971 family protein